MNEKHPADTIKQLVIDKVVASLKLELSVTLDAANNARLAATDEQSKAETQYDTLAIEAAYLAEGQTKRIEEIRHAIEQFNELASKLATSKVQSIQVIALGSLVEIFHPDSLDKPNSDALANASRWYFIAPAGAGFTCELLLTNSESTTNKKRLQTVTVITPQSPLGNALLGKQLDDEITLNMANNSVNADVVMIY